MRCASVLIALIVTAVTSTWLLAQTGLTGTTRDDFVKGAARACVRNNESAAAKLGINVEKFCDCYANRMADQISLKDVEVAGATHSLAGVQRQVDSANAACQKAGRQ
jgi:hypothetical protein